MCTPEEIGGGGFGYLAYFAAWEEIFRTCGMKYWLSHTIISHWAKGPSPVLREVTRQAARDVIPGLLAGETTLCFALSEPEAGSDAAMIKTRAEPDGDGWRLTGSKIWISNACHADYAIVFAVTEPELAARRKGGISAFLVPTRSKGFVIESLIKMWGHPGTEECLLRFDNVRIEPHQLVGKLHHGFDIAMLGVGFGRMYNSARAVGFSKWALEQAFDYVKVRKSFGKPIAEYQGVTFPLAQSAMEVHAAHLVALNAALLLDQGERAHKELSMCKAYAVQVGKAALDRVMQVHGAMGFTNEMCFTDAYMSMRKVNVADGTNEILANVIAKRMLAGDIEL
jgi:acyl-CoA dehydrogenase